MKDLEVKVDEFFKKVYTIKKPDGECITCIKCWYNDCKCKELKHENNK